MLEQYKGNFVKYLNEEFDPSSYSKAVKYDYKGINHLNLNTNVEVGILSSPDDNFYILEENEDKEEDSCLSINQVGKELLIKAKTTNTTISGNNFNNAIIGGNNVVIGNVHISGNNIRINGVQIGGGKSSKVTIFIPDTVTTLEVETSGSGSVAAGVMFNEADITATGQSSVGLAAKQLTIDTSSQSTVWGVNEGGNCKVSSSSQSTVRVKGEFNTCDICTSSQSKVVTEGTCKGTYSATASSQSSIRHKGNVKGRVKEKISSQASIDIN